MNEVSVPFKFKKLSGRRVTIMMEDLWEAAYAWARVNGYQKEHGHYQGLPAT